MDKMEKRTFVPDKRTYNDTINKLFENNKITESIAVRLGCELGMSRLEIVNAKVIEIDKIHQQGLDVSVSKRVRRGNKIINGGKRRPNYEMRIREIPINRNFYQILKIYIKQSGIYILQRERGDDNKAFHVDMIDKMYYANEIPWSSHKSRHYFKSQVWSWMMKNRRPDTALLKELMGHKKDTHETYGDYSWDYKLEVLDGTFSGD